MNTPRLVLAALALLLSGSTPLAAQESCEPSGTTLCLQDGRFRVELSWEDFEGATGLGKARSLTSDSGSFWFFHEDNVEVVVKVLDGRVLNDHFWVFYGSLSNVAFDLTVTDTETGNQADYHNPLDSFGSRGDVTALPAEPVGETSSSSSSTSSVTGSPIRGARPSHRSTVASGNEVLELRDGRFRLRVEWADFEGRTGVGHPVPLTADTGAFWFFDEANVELVVKVLDGRSITGHYWVYYGSLTDVEFRLTVTDTRTGRRAVYDNPSENFASRGDVTALSEEPLAGFGFSPRYFASLEFRWLAEEVLREFYAELDRRKLGIWAVNGQWWQLRSNGGELFPWVEQYIADYPALSERIVGGVQFTEPDTGLPRSDPEWEDAETWEDWNDRDGWDLYLEGVLALAARHHPPYLSVGVEINNFARNYPAEFERFATEIFPEIVAAVAEVSPETLVFPGFQFEQMAGDLRGFTDHNGEPGCELCVPFEEINSIDGRTYPPMGEVLNRFPAEVLTHVGFTTYPYFNRDFGAPADLPSDYYSRIYDDLDPEHQDVHLLFAESGWPSAEELSPTQACLLCAMSEPEADPVCGPTIVPDGACTDQRMQELADFYRPWLGGEQEQLDFVDRFRTLTTDLDPSLALWTMLHDADDR
ncbi:MAG: hypothetical protein R3234_12050, partial [Thermoanaerobaculia bacterium]|nr:hypothetical protein [Thermoanaerobaculia bacterium]